LSQKYRVQKYSDNEILLHFPLNGKCAQLIFRTFPASDLCVLNQVFEHHCYHPIVLRMLQTFSADDELKIIDAGSNVGYACVYFQSFFPKAEIVAIEPEDLMQCSYKKTFPSMIIN